eukprot:TRINITY_DN28795_c0_g1_i1.p4 TRINITY_DN28795_c0_g1~~TRINITY_DN28795_c0_g1_i1.p4  ORF type:complete len:101 (+),score=22.53 TRINITY_DN28795_c0_g1_i1:209-511(+)
MVREEQGSSRNEGYGCCETVQVERRRVEVVRKNEGGSCNQAMAVAKPYKLTAKELKDFGRMSKAKEKAKPKAKAVAKPYKLNAEELKWYAALKKGRADKK